MSDDEAFSEHEPVTGSDTAQRASARWMPRWRR